MPNEQIFMGTAVAVVCLVGLWKDRWFLANTKKGQQFVGWFGEAKAIWVMRGMFAFGMLFGILLAMNVIHPVQW